MRLQQIFKFFKLALKIKLVVALMTTGERELSIRLESGKE